MKKDTLKHLLWGLVMTIILASCSDENELQTCVLQKVSIGDPDFYQLIDYNDNGTIASVKIINVYGEAQRYDYSYTADKLSIYYTDPGISNRLEYEIGLDSQGRMISRAENNKVYERYFYNGDRLDHIMWSDKDSIAFLYSGTNKNPNASEFYDFNASNQTWVYSHTTTFTFDERPNPLKGLFLPFNHGGDFFFENNNTSYSSHGYSWYLAYTYNAEGYPVSRTLTSSSDDYSETTDFTFDCH